MLRSFRTASGDQEKNDQRGVAKVAVFAYSRITGRALWQSGTVEATSRANDVWVFGAGPFSRGSIRKRPELAGEPLPTIPVAIFGGHQPNPQAGPLGEQYFPNFQLPAPPPVIPAAMLGVTGGAALADKPVAR